MRGALLFCALPICRYSYIGRLQNGEVQNREAQRYRDSRDGEGRSPSSHLLDAESSWCWGALLPFYMGSLGSFCRFFGVFWRFLNFFQRTFGRLILRWLGVLLFRLGQNEPKPPYLWSTSPYFGLQTYFGICIVVWVAAARRKKRRTSSVFLLVRSGLTGFQLYSVLVSCLEDSQIACWWWWKSLGKKHCGVNHGKRICMAHKTLV